MVGRAGLRDEKGNKSEYRKNPSTETHNTRIGQYTDEFYVYISNSASKCDCVPVRGTREACGCDTHAPREPKHAHGAYVTL